MYESERIGVYSEDKPIFTKAPPRTPEELEEVDKNVKKMQKMM